MKRPRVIALFLCVLFLFEGVVLVCPVLGQAPVSALDSTVVRLDDVVVRSRREGSVTPTQIIDAQTINRLPNNSVADALRYFSGVQIKDYGGIGGLKTIDVHGMGSTHVGVFYDGVAVNNARNGVVDLGRFSLDNVESVALHNGSKDAIFQPAKHLASSSVLFMQSRRPVFDGDRRDNFRATLKGGSFGTVNPSVLWEHRFGGGGHGSVRSSVSAEALYSSGRYRFRYAREGGWDTTGVRTNGDIRLVRLEAGLFGDLGRRTGKSGRSSGSGGQSGGSASSSRGLGKSDNLQIHSRLGWKKTGEWSAKAYIYASERGYPEPVIKRIAAPGTDYVAGGANVAAPPNDREKNLDIFLQGSVRQQFTPTYSLGAQAKISHDRTRYFTGGDALYRQTEMYASVTNLFALTRWWNASLATDIQYNTLDAEVSALFDERFPYPRRLTSLTAATTGVNLAKFSAQASLLYTHASDFRGSAASDANTSAGAGASTGVGIGTGAGADRSTGVSKMAPAKSAFSPTVAAAWRPLRGLSMRLLYKRSFRLPTFNDLYYNEIGNRNLRPEHTTQYSLGVAYSGRFGRAAGPKTSAGTGREGTAIDASVDVYLNEARDKIVATPTSNQLIWTMLNLGRVEIRGVDAVVAPRFRLGKADVSARLSYTFSDTSGGDPVPYMPRHSGSAIVGVAWGRGVARGANGTTATQATRATRAARGWSVDYSFIYSGERYRLGSQTVTNRLEAWHTHDLSVSRVVSLSRGGGNKTAKFTAQINNIFNRRYEIVRWYPMPGTNVKLIITISL